MKIRYFLLLFLFLGFQGFSQTNNKVIGVDHKITSAVRLDLDKVYNKKTGEKMTREEITALMRVGPRVHLEPAYGEDGKVDRFYYFPDAVSNIQMSRPEALVAGKPFPDFEMKTTSGEKLRLQDLKGKVVVLHFALDAMRFRYDELEKLDAQINGLERKEAVEAIIIIGSGETHLRSQFDPDTSNFSLVNHGGGFIARYGLEWLPFTLVIDGDGKLVGGFKRVEELNLKSHL